MSQPTIIVAGIGPGSAGDITPAVLEAVRQSDVIIGYKYYSVMLFNSFRSCFKYCIKFDFIYV